MKSTGIVRKVDELGRVVIPKELRKISFISEGTPLEIYSGDDGEIIFKKYSQLKNIKFFSDIIADSLEKITRGKVAVFEKDEVISSSGISVKSATNFFTENSFDKIHNKRGIIKVPQIDIFFAEIKSEDQVVGGIMVWGIDNFSDTVIGAVNVMAEYLSRLIS